MNIKITYNWLLDYLETDADAYEMQKYLSLCGPSIETVEKIGDDFVMDIEITSNRVDMASVFGIAQEAQAILPQFGKKAKLKFNPLEKYTFFRHPELVHEPVRSTVQDYPVASFAQLHGDSGSHKKRDSGSESGMTKSLNIKIEDHDLVPRFTALIFSNINIKQAPDYMRKRLEMADVKSINNVIDISNYLMLSLGQPTHIFDYDQIEDHTMIVRRSKKGEKLITLDDKEIVLPGDDIVIEDGSGRLIDLCGIMGGLNSSITKDTENILFFVQTYNKRHIRHTSMVTGQRTVAATYFEKGLDPARVETTLVYGVDLITELTGGTVNSQLYDIYPHPAKEKEVKVYLSDIQHVMGIPVEEEKVISILENLGFKVEKQEIDGMAYPDSVKYLVTVPTYRVDDVNIKEDIIEEVARVYGYFNLPNNISPLVYIEQPKEIEAFFETQTQLKYLLKHIGLHEVMNYSMISGDLIEKLDLSLSDHLKMENTISTEIEYMRTSLIPSLLKNMSENMGKRPVLKLFEIAKIYIPQKNELPNEQYKLGIAVNTDFFDLKGIIEVILDSLHITDYSVRQPEVEANQSREGGDPAHLLSAGVCAEIVDKKSNKAFGLLGKLRQTYKNNLDITDDVFVAEIDIDYLIKNKKSYQPYKQPYSYAVIKLDANIENKGKSFEEIKNIAHKTSKLLINVEYLESFKDAITLRFYFSSLEKNITEEEAKKEQEKILKEIN